ncbi:major facilitator superfamily transporter [Lasiosphaeris hirsuta]|uniref:Major facilitator superfamily transporter n=1 Tax=Lasiosphaeris hirsuta TaxID=260670 RepID=A0AA40E4Y9_9PEZI|nr:major facilitator superfamily transporter [Lasiosphaeris hirsuta]
MSSLEDIEKQSDAVVEEGVDESEHEDDSESKDSGASADPSPHGGLSTILSRAISRTSTKSVNPGPPPDGGLQAWTAAICGHLIVVTTWGFITSFGVFQTYFTATLGRAPSDISWIGSMQIFLIFFIGAVTGRLTDAGYFRHVFLLGALFQMLGVFASSFAGGSYWQLFLSQGVAMGLGNGFLFCPTMVTVSTYFSARRNLAIGVVASGTATGGLVFPAMARQLLPAVGFPWAMRAIGFVQLACLVVAGVFLRPRLRPRKAGPLLELGAFKELEYTFYTMGSFSCFLGVYFAFYYIASFSRDVVGMSYTDSLNLLLVANGIGLPGRLVVNFFADRIGPVNMFIPTAVSAGILMLSWMAVDSTTGMYIWSVLYGVAGGAIQSLFPAGLSSLTTDLRKQGVRMGMVFSINSFATLMGPPIAGAILTASGGNYHSAQAFAGAMLLLGAGFMFAARVVRGRKAGGWMVRV